MIVPLIGRLSLLKKHDSYPLEADIAHLVQFLKHYRKEIRPVDALEFLSTFAFMGTYSAQDTQTLEKHYRLRIPAGQPKTITQLHRQFFDAILPFAGKQFWGNQYTKTRGVLVERLTLAALKMYEGEKGDYSMILLENGESFGLKINAEHEELDLVVYPENQEMAIGECKADGSRFHTEHKRARWYELAAERIEHEGMKTVNIFAVCATNADIMTKHLKSMATTRRWWLFSISEHREPWKLDP
jgi:hypothetical protein